MINTSSKYNMTYFNIPQLENKLNKTGLSISLWQLTKKKLAAELHDAIPGNNGRELSFLKDISDEKDSDGNTLFRGLFVVSCEKTLTESEMQILLTQYLKENPKIDRTIPSTTNIKTTTNESNKLSTIKATEINNDFEDLNKAVDNLEQENRIFGVVDDINHLPQISQIEGIEIIENVGDFNKTYFSIASFRQDEVLAHSVTILKSIKCKRSLLDFIK